MNLAIKEGLLLNVDPINMENENSWGNGVTLKGVQEGDGYGYNGDAILFDGVDDYIEIYADTPISEGLTFEFYGKSNDSIISMLSKTIKKDVGYPNRFRTRYCRNSDFEACFSSKNSESDWKRDETSNVHWIRKSLNYDFNSEQGGYDADHRRLQPGEAPGYVRSSEVLHHRGCFRSDDDSVSLYPEIPGKGRYDRSGKGLIYS